MRGTSDGYLIALDMKTGRVVYDVVIDDVLGAPVASFEIDHDAQKIVLKTGANENYG